MGTMGKHRWTGTMGKNGMGWNIEGGGGKIHHTKTQTLHCVLPLFVFLLLRIAFGG